MKPNYGDNEFKGNGIIKCAACGDPLRDHPIGPCSTLQSRTIYVARPATRSVIVPPQQQAQKEAKK